MEELLMIRRTFLKALCAGPLGFLLPRRRSGTKYLGSGPKIDAEFTAAIKKAKKLCPLYGWIPVDYKGTIIFDTLLHATFDVKGKVTGYWWKVDEENHL
jgi:hypothetical protein